MPILPLFIASLGGSGLAVGIIGGLRESIESLLKVFWGWWSDRTGKRKVLLIWGYFISAIFKFLLAFAKVWPHILVFAALERVGKGVRVAPQEAIIADSMPQEKGYGFGIHRALDTAGAIVGSLTVFFLFWRWGFSFKAIILTAALLALLSFIPLSFVGEKKKEPQQITLKISLRALSLPAKLFILISAIFVLANFSYMFFILRTQEVLKNLAWGEKWTVGLPILGYVLFNIAYAGLAVPCGIVSDQVGRRKILITGYLLFALTCLGFVFVKAISGLIFLFILYGIVYALVEGNSRAYIADLSPAEFRATALGTFHTTVGLVALPSSLIAGFLWQNISPQATFIYGATVGALPAVLFLALRGYFAGSQQ